MNINKSPRSGYFTAICRNGEMRYKREVFRLFVPAKLSGKVNARHGEITCR